MSRPKVAWFTPLQPIESGISLYSEDILPLLAKVADIDVIVDGYRPRRLVETGQLRVKDARHYNPSHYDLSIYQVGNSPVHIYMLPEVSRNPGLLVLHDTVLNHLFVQESAAHGTLLTYRAEMERRYGPDGGKAADRVLKGQAPDDLFRFPMSESIVQCSRATLVHSEFARQQVLARSPEADVIRVPHGLVMPEYVERSHARRILGIPDDQFLVASISHINPHKRIDVVLRALKKLRRSIPARLILAGSVSPNFPLGRMINHLGLDQVVDTPGYVTDREARLIAAAANVIVNLRYPTAGETSGSLLHSMAAGRPVIVSQTGSFTEVPKSAAIRVPVDALEEQMLASVLNSLARDDSLQVSIGQEARAFIDREHSLQRWVEGYVDVIARLTGRELKAPTIESVQEPVLATGIGDGSRGSDLLTKSLGRDIAELGLGGDSDLLEDVARAQVELGLGVGIITDEAERGHEQSGEPNER